MKTYERKSRLYQAIEDNALVRRMQASIHAQQARKTKPAAVISPYELPSHHDPAFHRTMRDIWLDAAKRNELAMLKLDAHNARHTRNAVDAYLASIA